MKCERIDPTGRVLNVHELPVHYPNSLVPRELQIRIDYIGLEMAVFKAIALDNIIIPAIVEALNKEV